MSRAEGQDASSESSQTSAVRLGHRALRHFSAGNFLSARDDFEEAERLAHSPVFLLYQARAERQLGHYLRARDLLARCSQEPVHKSTPDAWQSAITDAEKELAQLTLEIPSVRFLVDGEPTYPITIRTPSREVPATSESVFVQEFDPGVLDLWALDTGGTSIRSQIVLGSGQKEVVVVLSFPRILPLLSRRPPERVSLREVPMVEVGRATRIGGHTALALGGSAALFSAVTATVAFTKARAVKRRCIESHCRPEDQDLGASAVRWANLATVGTVVGVTGVATGVGLLLLPAKNGAELSVSRRF